MTETGPVAAAGGRGGHEAAARETRDLTATVAALRAELESQAADRDAAVQAAVERSADEINQLRASVAALRRELEREAADRDDAPLLQTVVRAYRGEADAAEVIAAVASDKERFLASYYLGALAATRGRRQEARRQGPGSGWWLRPNPGRRRCGWLASISRMWS